MEVVAERSPRSSGRTLFAWRVAKHVTSNAIAF
jgi:AICAR transformylase/IMP cyclohydrolase PurH